jgi:hypothetical protein
LVIAGTRTNKQTNKEKTKKKERKLKKERKKRYNSSQLDELVQQKL